MRKKASQRKQCLTSRSHGAENAQGLGWEQTIVYSHWRFRCKVRFSQCLALVLEPGL